MNASIKGFLEASGDFTIRMPPNNDHVGAIFGNTDEHEGWTLLVILNTEDQSILWSARQAGKHVAHHACGMIWANGRLTTHPALCELHLDAPLRFKAFIDSVGLSFGTIEAELRSLTGYIEAVH